jgi:hypothetical protein
VVNTIDATTWQALGLTLTLVGLLVSLVVWRSRGGVAGLRAVAWSLLPAAAGLTGTLRLLWDIGRSIVDWAARLVFNPLMWSGIALAGFSLALFALTAALRARVSGSRDTGTALPGERSRPAAQPSKKKGRPAAGDDDMDDIEAILRKHGIS